MMSARRLFMVVVVAHHPTACVFVESVMHNFEMIHCPWKIVHFIFINMLG